MIEIVNTSNQEVDLSTYYLADNGAYYALPLQSMQVTVQQNDFIVKFPPSAKLAAHGVVVVAIDTPMNFAATYGVAPSFSVVDGSMQTIAMNGQPTLTNEGEAIVLFQWDGQSDLVRDVDILLAGRPTAPNDLWLEDKSGDQRSTSSTQDRSRLQGHS